LAWRLVGGVVVVLPTYNERENLERIADAILTAVPEATLLVVDDSSPDGTGTLADTMAAREPRLHVLHRTAKEGLGAAYREGFRWAVARSETRAIVQMDADFSHDPGDLPRLLAPLMTGSDLVLGTRYMPGGRTVGWPLRRKLISRAGTTFARVVLLLPYRDLTGGFKAWRRELLEAIRLRRGERQWLWLPDRDDVVGAPTTRGHHPGPDHLPRAGGGELEDERRHRPRGAETRPPPPLRGDPGRLSPDALRAVGPLAPPGPIG